MKLALFGFVFFEPNPPYFFIIPFNTYAYAHFGLPQIGFVFSNRTHSTRFGFRNSNFGFPAKGRHIGFVFSQPAAQYIAIISFQIRVYADFPSGKLALFFQIAH